MADGADPRARMVDMLLEKIGNDPFPSNTMMDMVEELLLPDEVPAYAAVLIQKMREENFPSVSMMRRVISLAQPA